ncbi:hypothetical protein F9L00_03500 [Brucella anthropi]|uniref:hypothetical protein n=1 Tax=Brucella/Ochrobactrum group TaxID=2826938 RepID=UPI00124DB546|nr:MULTISPECIES: hypothetical protein [Brucella/Ochrobactrum group]KAB2764783.1 hypothetical protein F9K98_01165 [Brucella anthropi]KAB2782546.1 hypothetical protein F9L00_03500 [Brucella anthropi]MCQ9143329.1 hypothetical protein [Ochrobactrum sp. BTU2]UGQ23864.1 hypothetical protein LRL11_16540 [Brucella anthropi]
MHLKAIRGSFGDFGRVQKGQILQNVAKTVAEKLIKSGAYVEATANDIRAAGSRTELGILDAKALLLKSAAAPESDLERDLANAKTEIEAANAKAKTAEDALAQFRTEAETEINNLKVAVSEASSEKGRAKLESDSRIKTLEDDLATISKEYEKYKQDAEARIADMEVAAKADREALEALTAPKSQDGAGEPQKSKSDK